jgi:hypothetical protein
VGGSSDLIFAYLMTEAYEERKMEAILLIFVLGDLWRGCDLGESVLVSEEQI